MSTRRMDRLYEHLSTRERALLSIRHAHERTNEPLALRRSMPEAQIPEFNRYIGVARGTTLVLGLMALMLLQEVEALRLRLLCLRTFLLWSEDREHVFHAAWLHSRELVTESEYATRLERARKEYLPLDEAIELVLLNRQTEAESDEEWERLEREVESELRAAAAGGTLLARKRSLAVQYGSLCDWLGVAPHVPGEVALHLEVVPDGQAERARQEREALQRTRDLLERGMRVDPLALRADYEPAEESAPSQEGATTLAERVREDYVSLRGKLLAIEAALAKAEEQFGGERVVGSDEEQTLEAFRGGLDELEDELVALLGPLPEPIRDEDFAAQVEQAIEREIRR